MHSLIKRVISESLSYCGFSLVRSERFSQLVKLQELLMPGAHNSGVSYIPENKIGNTGISLNIARQLSFLQKLSEPRFQELFRIIRDDFTINTGFMGKDYRNQGLIHNGYYPTPDAELYAAFIAQYRPAQIIEIGSGYSTVIAHKVISHLGIRSEITVIDPEPRCDVGRYASHIEYKPVENSSILDMEFNTNDRTILFIDSSHITKMGGDVPLLYCKLLPGLPSGVIVQVHDIFTPFDYPENYAPRFYTEQYLLQALLANSRNLSVLFATHLMSRENAPQMRAIFGPSVGSNPLFFGASFWMEVV